MAKYNTGRLWQYTWCGLLTTKVLSKVCILQRCIGYHHYGWTVDPPQVTVIERLLTLTVDNVGAATVASTGNPIEWAMAAMV